MASNAVVKTVGKKLKYYFEVKRLEDGFDLHGLTQSPRADSAGTRVLPNLQKYLEEHAEHERMRQKKMASTSPNERRIKKNILRQMNRYHYLLTTPSGISVCDAMYPPKSASPRTSSRRSLSSRSGRRSPSPRHRKSSPRRCRSPRGKSSPLPEYFYVYSTPQPRLDPRATGFGVPLRPRRRRAFKHQTTNVRQAPPHYVSRGEAERLVNAATRLLMATSTVDKIKRPKSASASAPRPFESAREAPYEESSAQVQEDRKPRPATAKFSWDINGRRVRSQSPKARDDSCINLRRYVVEREPVNNRLPRSMVERPQSGTSASSKSLRSRSSTQTSATSDTDTTYERLKPAPPPHRPRSAKYRSRTIINTGSGGKSKEEVGVVESTQTQSDHVGIQTEKKLLQQYDYLEEEVKDGEWGEYQIYIRTGNRIGASTRADVKLTLYGSRGRTKEFTLTDSKRHKIPFQKGKEDLFILPAHHVGKLVKIKVGHDRPELSFAWYLEGVTVFDMNDKRIYEFPCERWLSGQDGDCRTYRELPADRERAFIEAFEKDSDSGAEQKPSPRRRRHSSSSSSASSTASSSGSSTPREKSDDVSVKAHQSNKAAESRSSSTGSRSRSSSSGSETYSDSETDSKSEAVVSVSETDTRKSKPAKNKADVAFFDQKISGPTFTFHNKDGERAASQPEVEYLEGYKAAVVAATEEQMHREEEERLHEREILKGPTIHQAARSGNLARIKELLQHFPEMLESPDEHGSRPLHLAANSGHMDIIKWLTASDAELEAETPTGYTAMHLAAMSGHVKAMVVLAAMGASTSCKTMDQQTPLHLAARGGHLECVKWLVANRARVDVEDSSGRTPCHLAEEYDRHQVVEFLGSCQRELLNPRSGFAQLQSRNLEPIAEDAASAVSGEERWKDDKSESELVEAGSEDENEDSRHSQSQKAELEEKRRLYEEQHAQMEKKGMSFLDSIRQEMDNP